MSRTRIRATTALGWFLFACTLLLVAVAVSCQVPPVRPSDEGRTIIPLQRERPLRVRLALTAEADSALTTALDTASDERGWCLRAHVDTAQGIVYVDRAWTPPGLLAWPDSDKITCPPGLPIAHLHFLERGHVDGPSPRDVVALGHWDYRGRDSTWVRDRPFGLVLVRQLDRQHLRFVVYGLSLE